MIRFLSLVGAAGLTAGVALFPAQAQMGHGGHMGDGGASHSYMQAMKSMHDGMAGMELTGKPGVDFALMMIPHHQSAIEMAKAYLESGEDDAELTRLSEEIIAAQEGEIAFLKDWLAKNRQ